MFEFDRLTGSIDQLTQRRIAMRLHEGLIRQLHLEHREIIRDDQIDLSIRPVRSSAVRSGHGRSLPCKTALSNANPMPIQDNSIVLQPHLRRRNLMARYRPITLEGLLMQDGRQLYAWPMAANGV